MSRKRKDNDGGVVSLEAAILVPLFIFLMLFFYGIIIMFMGQHMISHAMIQSSQSLSFDPYATERLKKEEIDGLVDSLTSIYLEYGTDEHFSSTDKWYSDNQDMLEEVAKKRFIGFLSGGGRDRADRLLNIFGIKGGIDTIDFSGCSVADGVLTFTIKYDQDFIFDFHGLASFERTMSIQAKLWGIKMEGDEDV